MKALHLLGIFALIGSSLILTSCGPSARALKWEAQMGPVPDAPVSYGQVAQAVSIREDYIPKGRYGRRWHRPMEPKYITIHSTQNYSGDAHAHANALKRGRLRGGTCGYLCWHYTVQDDAVIQHLPTNERGEHADFDGPGNRYSIGIEMCEHRGNNIAQTIDRTAMLTAALMHEHDIPLSNVVAHYHWPREGYSTPHKNCPHFLLDDGKPKGTWRWFKDRVKAYYDRIHVERPPVLAEEGEEGGEAST